jgi:hypothetical protein
MRQPDAPPSARVQAIGILLDRGWGKAVQPIAGDDGEPLTIVIRQILEHAPDADPVPIDAPTRLVS